MTKYVLVKDEKDLIRLYQNGVLKEDYGYLSKESHKMLSDENLITTKFISCANNLPTIFKFDKSIDHQPNTNNLWSNRIYLKWVQKCTSTKKFIKQYKEQNEKISNNKKD